MLNEFIVALFLSICTTAVLYILANLFKKKFKINHPKNTYLIYIIVLFTAASIFPFATIAFSTTNDSTVVQEMNIPDIKGVPITDSTIITENENITYASSITPILDDNSIKQNGITRYIQKISWNELVLVDNYKRQDSTDEISENTNEYTSSLNISTLLKKKLITLSNNKMKPSELINQIVTTLIIDQKKISGKETEGINEKEQNNHLVSDTKNNEEQTKLSGIFHSELLYFYYAILLLFLISVIYIFTSIYHAKNRILQRLNAKKCNDPYILKLIESISHEFNIKPPDVYHYDGPPNAFVFGYPTTIAFSTELKRYLSTKEFEAAIRHELAHIKNHDIFIKPILQGIRIFFFYNPIVHILCLKIMKNREILADASSFASKKDKISLMEAIMKVQEYTKSTYDYSFPSYQIPLLSYNPGKLSITERFTNLFEITTKKTALTMFVSAIILFANVSIFFVAGSIFERNDVVDDTTVQKQEFSIEESYYSESVQYTKIKRNATIYIAKIVKKNLYNVISAETQSSEIIQEMLQKFSDENIFYIYQQNTKPF